MADFTGNPFIAGLQAGQAALEHRQALEDSKLRQQILKHQIENLKIEDQVRARELQQQNLALMNGEPEAEIPGHDVTSQQPNLPSQSLAGMMTNLIRGHQAAPVDAAPPEDPRFVPAPGAQAAAPQQHPVTKRVLNPMTIGGVPGLGVPGLTRTPTSMEEMTRRSINAEFAKFVKLGPGERLELPLTGQTIAKGGPEIRAIGAAGLGMVDPDTGRVSKVAEGRPPTPRAPQRPIRVGNVLLDPDTHQVIFTAPGSNAADNAKVAREQADWRLFMDEWNARQEGQPQIPIPGTADQGFPQYQKAPWKVPSQQDFKEWQRRTGTAGRVSGPSGPPQGASTSGFTVQVGAKTYRFNSQAELDAFKHDAGLQ